METTVIKQYLICYKEPVDGDLHIGTYNCEALNMKEAVKLLRSISLPELEILSISELDNSIKGWQELR